MNDFDMHPRPEASEAKEANSSAKKYFALATISVARLVAL